MSFQAIRWAYKQPVGGPSERLMLVTLADMADRTTSSCYPSYATLGNRCAMSRRNAIRIIAKLVKARLIRVSGRANGNRQTSNRFILMMGTNAPCDNDNLSPTDDDNLALGSDTGDPGGSDANVTEVVTPPSPEAVDNRKVNRQRSSADGARALAADFIVPDEWLDLASAERTDLSVQQICIAATSFVAHYARTGIKVCGWRQYWLRWIRREEASRQSSGSEDPAYGDYLELARLREMVCDGLLPGPERFADESDADARVRLRNQNAHRLHRDEVAA